MDNKKYQIDVRTLVFGDKPASGKSFYAKIELDPAHSHSITIITPEGKMYGTNLEKVIELLEDYIGGSGFKGEIDFNLCT
jgi:hypothetical protein